MRPSLDFRHVHVSKPWDGINFAGEISDRVSWLEMLVSLIEIRCDLVLFLAVELTLLQVIIMSTKMVQQINTLRSSANN